MANDKNDNEELKKELETFRTEYRSLIGRAIISGLISPNPGGVGGIGGIGRDIFLRAPNYDQDGGDYTQNNGGGHTQDSGGNYNQG